ncbi:GNAT family N-acetyltransferase [Novosphingobium sp. MMS21-SN21R]|uniref:GNAT family N-acetyltransferase n=1 Tax=Novosphingobium sp. MMS21-SN21R TaxID=2969298 RepID=UPI002884083B|nr:GNAT family N-acetyltransferase [Novosphingobium sp. MMS21-SN21R]MDT0508829.1 GNAT family N-acetyltransferase [Novosphingobium sp. MMS21-SN21R]
MNAPPFILSPAATPLAPPGTVHARALPWHAWADDVGRSRWHALAEAATTPNPFFEPWYLIPALESFDAKGAVQLFLVELGDELVGLLPVAPMRKYGRWPFPHLASWLHANAFLGVPLVRAGYEALFWQALADWADTNHGAGLFLHLAGMPLEQPLTQALFDLCHASNRTAGLVMREQRALLFSPLGPEAYLERALTGKKRKELRRQHTRLSEQGDLEFERRSDATGIAPWIDAFLHLERTGWKGTAGSAMACAPETETLFRKSLEQAATLGKLERLALTLDGKPIAMLANFLTPPGSFSYKTAFDEDYARFSPGVLLQRENLALLNRDDIAWCDSCAAPDHPMIDSLWTERRPIGRISVAIGGTLRRSLFNLLLKFELGRNPTGLDR